MSGVINVWLRHVRVFRTFLLAAVVGNLGEPLLYLLSLGYGLGFYIQQIEGMSYEDIARIMDCPIGTVRSRIFRAREAIAERLRPLLDTRKDQRW